MSSQGADAPIQQIIDEMRIEVDQLRRSGVLANVKAANRIERYADALTAGPQQEDMTVAEALERTGFLTLRDLVIEGYEKRGDVLDLANRTTRRYRDKAALTAGQTGEPQLQWEGPDDEGDYIVTLTGFPKIYFYAHGQTRELALHLLGEQLHECFKEGCDICQEDDHI